jgi:cell division protein FtsB
MAQTVADRIKQIIALKDTVKALRKELAYLQREKHRLQKEVAEWKKCWKSYADNEWKKRLGF